METHNLDLKPKKRYYELLTYKRNTDSTNEDEKFIFFFFCVLSYKCNNHNTSSEHSAWSPEKFIHVESKKE